MRPSLILATVLVTWSAQATAANVPSPHQLVQNTMDQLALTLKSRRAEFEEDPSKLRAVVNELFLPSVDTDYGASLLLGDVGKHATDEQRQRFFHAFYQVLVNQYAEGLLYYRNDRIKVLPARGKRTGRRETVHTLVTFDDGTVIPVDYRLHMTAGGWKVYDVVIEGISWLHNQRAVIGARVRDVGLDRYLDELEQQAKDSARI